MSVTSFLRAAARSIDNTVHDLGRSAQQSVSSFAHAISTPEGQSYFSLNEYSQFASGEWAEGASFGQKLFGGVLGATVAAGTAAAVVLAAEAGVAGAVVKGASALLAGAATFIAEHTVGTALISTLGLGAANLRCASDEDANNPNSPINTPEASVPVTQDQWCDGIRSLTAAPISDASSLISRFPGISDHLRNLPAGMSVIGVAPQDPNVNPHAVFAYVLVQNRRPVSEREATEVATYVLRYERNGAGTFVPSDNRSNDPLGALRNVAYFSSVEADSITYVPASAFASSNQADGAARANLFHPSFTAVDSVILRYENGQMSIFPYGQNTPVGGSDVCAAYGQSITPVAIDASLPFDGSSVDAPANRDVRNDSGDASDTGIDAGVDAARDANIDAGADVRSDVRDAGTDARDAGDVRDASDVRDAGDARSDVADAPRG